jgi:hypothetical protein
LPLAAQPTAIGPPERDIVAVESVEPLSSADQLPGMLAGQRIMRALGDGLSLVRGGVSADARPGLDELARELHQLQSGKDLEGPLPASYWAQGQLWIPVRAESMRARLDAPDIRQRPQARGTGGRVGNLPVRARRIAWLPVARSARLVHRALPLLSTGEFGRDRAQQLLEAALHGVRTRVELENRPLILAYYSVERALAAAPRWDERVRRRLRRDAEALARQPELADLADRTQAQADRLTPDLRAVEELALALRKRIVSDAGAGPGSESPASRP